MANFKDTRVGEVLELEYIKKLRVSLNFIGVWPNKQFGDTSRKAQILSFYHYVLFFICSTAFILQLSYLTKNRNTLGFINLGHTYITSLMSIVFTQRMLLPSSKKYCSFVEEYVRKLHLIHHKDNSEYMGKTHKQVERICTLFSLISNYQMYIGICMFNFVPLYNNYSSGMFSSDRPINGTFEHSVYYDLPLDQFTNFRSYVIVFWYNWFASVIVSFAFVKVDLLLCLVVIHLWGHLTVIIYDLTHFPQPDIDMSDRSARAAALEAKNNHDFERLRDILQRHRMIKEFLTNTTQAFSITLITYYGFHLLSGCVLLLECSTLDPEALVRFGPLTLIMFQQMIQVSVIFELIGTKGDMLVEAVYELPWENMSVKNRRLVSLFLHNVQTPLAVKAGEMVPVGIQTMSAILRTSWSYFLMLRTFSE